jgi:hypothetical protein
VRPRSGVARVSVAVIVAVSLVGVASRLLLRRRRLRGTVSPLTEGGVGPDASLVALAADVGLLTHAAMVPLDRHGGEQGSVLGQKKQARGDGPGEHQIGEWSRTTIERHEARQQGDPAGDEGAPDAPGQ